jgi:hypothetical protein
MWFHCNWLTVAPPMLAGAVGLAAAAGALVAAAAGALVAAPAGALVGLAAAAVVGAAAGALVGAAAGGALVGAGCEPLGPQAAARRTTLLPSTRLRTSRRVFMAPPSVRCFSDDCASIEKD